jgi:hypothetical protein
VEPREEEEEEEEEVYQYNAPEIRKYVIQATVCSDEKKDHIWDLRTTCHKVSYLPYTIRVNFHSVRYGSISVPYSREVRDVSS